MGKKGGGGKGGGGGKSTSSTPASEAPKAMKVGLGTKGQEQIEKVIRGSSTSSASSVDLGSKRLAKRLEGLFERLTEIGFKEQQIEKALTACCLGGDERGVSLETVLDWLVLNFPPNELPAQFADPESREVISRGQLDVGHVGGGLSHDKGGGRPVTREIELEVPAIAASVLRKEDDEDHEVDKSWILGYAQREANAEAEARRTLKAQENAAKRWETLTPEQKLSRLEESYKEETRKAKEAKDSGRAGRREKAEMEARLKDIREQISELRMVVGQRKREMKKLKDQFLSDMQSEPVEEAAAVSSSALSNGFKQSAGLQIDEDALGSMFDDDDDEEEDEGEEEAAPAQKGGNGQQQPQQITVAPPPVVKGSFEQSVIDGLFGADPDSDHGGDDVPPARSRPGSRLAAEGPSPPAAVASKAQQEAIPRPSSQACPSPDRVVPGALEEGAVPSLSLEGKEKRSTSSAMSKKNAQQPPQQQPPPPLTTETKAPPPSKKLSGVPKNWSGKTPKRQLEEYLQKRKIGKANFQRVMDGRDPNGCVLTIRVTSSLAGSGGGGTSTTQEELQFESVGEFLGHADAQHAAASRALYHLEPMLQLSRVLPPPFRDWWQEWQEEAKRQREEEAAALKRGKKDRIQHLVQSMRGVGLDASSSQKQSTEKTDKASRGGFGLPDNSDFGWEDQAVEGQEESGSLAKREQGEEEEKQRLEQQQQKQASRETGKALRQRFEHIRKKRSYQELAKMRTQLPVAATREEILACIQKERVLVVSGETGSGKSTQIAQYILEDALLRGEGHKVSLVCTQPRRVAAVSIAERVAQEMGETGAGASGSLVGYQIRMESRTGPSTRLVFCTTGILLRRLQSDPELRGYTHIILDEVHERQALGDFLLVVLRDLLERRPDLRLILMSATVNAELFCNYFGVCPSFSIPGRYFPVQEHYLEDALEGTRHFIEEGSLYARKDSRAQYKRTIVEVSGRGGNTYSQRLEWQEGDSETESRRGPAWSAFMDESREAGYDAMTLKSLGRVDETVINFDLLEDLLRHIVESEEDHVTQGDAGWRSQGAILVFLPGLGEIRSLLERLQGGRFFRDDSFYWVLPLHSALTSSEQQKVFQRPPAGARKIILSTNIAETSVTIDDVAYVIDCGLVREVQLANKGRGGTRALVTTWCSRASAKQRMGRAGRVGPGVCFRLFSRFTYSKVMEEFAVPELQRTPLEELCLQIRAGGLAPSCREFLLKAPEPPSTIAIDAAVQVLKEVGALVLLPSGQEGGPETTEGSLTPLGVHLAKLPLDVRLGKMLVLAALFRCLDPVLTIAAALSGTKSPLVTPLGKEQEARAAHAKFEIRQSDFLTLANVFKAFRAASQGGRGSSGGGGAAAAELKFCNQHFLGRITLREMADLKCQYLSLLIDMGLVPRPAKFATHGGGLASYDALEEYMEGPAKKAKGPNVEAGNTNLVLASVAAGLYPHVVRATEAVGSEKRPTFSHGPPSSTSQVCLYPSSVNHSLQKFTSPWLVFHEKFHTTRAYVSPTSVVSPYALLLFGGPLAVDHLSNRVVIDNWIDFTCPARTAVLFREMRKRLNEVLEEMIRQPLAQQQSKETKGGGQELEGGHHEAVVDAMVSLLKSEDVKAAWLPGGPDDPDNRDK